MSLSPQNGHGLCAMLGSSAESEAALIAEVALDEWYVLPILIEAGTPILRHEHLLQDARLAIGPYLATWRLAYRYLAFNETQVHRGLMGRAHYLFTHALFLHRG